MLILIAGDVALLYAMLALVLFMRYQENMSTELWQKHFWPFTVVFAIWLLVFYISGLYDQRFIKTGINFYTLALRTIAINAVIGIAFFYVFSSRFFSIRPQVVLAVFLVIHTVIYLLWRRFYSTLVLRQTFVQNVLFIGEGKDMDDLVGELHNRPYLGFRVAEVIHASEGSVMERYMDMGELCRKHNIQIIVTSLALYRYADIVNQLYRNLALGISYFDLPTFYERITGKVPVQTIGQLWFLENIFENEKRLYEVIKRGSDIVAALLFSIIGIVLTPFIATAIKLSSPGPVFFRQKRIGRGGKVFQAIKFRSMTIGADKSGPQWTQKDDPRITRVGNILRKLKLDEIPQLINVLRGEMSFIGPRPEQPEFVEQLTQQVPYYNERHLIKPGLTGWAQIHFPYAGASKEDTLVKLQYDLYYLKNRSLLLDLGIVLKTINIVISRNGR